jgi:hypothetical protein
MCVVESFCFFVLYIYSRGINLPDGVARIWLKPVHLKAE